MKKALVLMVAAACAASAQAALVKVSFEGTNSSPTVTNTVFGEAVQTVKGYAIYESDTPGTLFSPFNGITNNYIGSMRAFSFDVLNAAGQSVFSGLKSVDTGFGYAQVRDGSVGQDRLSFNSMTLNAAEVNNDPAFFSNVQFTLGLASTGANAIGTAALMEDFDPAIFNGQKNLSLFVARQGGAPSGVTVSFNFNFTDVQVEPLAAEVPEPGSLALLGAALAGLTATRRKNGNRRTNKTSV